MFGKVTEIGFDNILLGEGPLWLENEKRVAFIDIDGKRLFKFNPKTYEATYTELPLKTSSVVITSKETLILAMEDGIYTEDFKLIVKRPNDSGIRFNDGKASPDGKYFIGTIDKGSKGKLYSLEKGKLLTILEGVTVSNGLDWSPDGKWMYYCDTPTRKIVAYSYPDFKSVKTVIDFNEISCFEGNPDGLCIDSNGDIWVAIWGGSCVIRIATKNGTIAEKVELSTKFISCPAFIGEKFDTLFITSAKNGLEDEGAGNCFMFKPKISGRAPFRVDINNLG